ncbi:MAG: DUF2796 domain-containing protein [Gammaproteobacteria bacterium]|nr:DUF2796 domain-containing protein [Gammaproteobacteria bacterium]
MHKFSLLFLVTAIAAAPAFAATSTSKSTDKEAGFEQHAGHTHGIGQLQVTLEGNELGIGLDSPTDSFLGFEHAANTAAQKKKVQETEQLLKQPEKLFELPAAAQCQAQPSTVDIKLPTAGSKEKHSDLETQWRWQCKTPAELKQIDVRMFKAFPKLKQLKVQMVTPNGQNEKVLKADNTRLALTP